MNGFSLLLIRSWKGPEVAVFFKAVKTLRTLRNAFPGHFFKLLAYLGIRPENCARNNLRYWLSLKQRKT